MTQDDERTDGLHEGLKRQWTAMRHLLDKGFDLMLEREAAPAASVNPLKKTQSSLQRDIGHILDKASDILEISDLRELGERVAKLEKLKAGAGADIAEYQLRRLTLPGRRGLAFWREDRKGLDKKIGRSKGSLKEIDEDIGRLKLDLARSLADKGVRLDPRQVDGLLSSITCDNELAIIATYDNIKIITQALKSLMRETGGIDGARRYYGMTAVLLAILLRLQEKYLFEATNSFLPRLGLILDQNAGLIEETTTQLREASGELAGLYAANLASQRAIAAAGGRYRELLEKNLARVERAKKRTEEQIVYTINAYRTVENAASLVVLMKESEKAFDALNDLGVPDLVAFRVEDLAEFQNLTTKLKELSA